jgi:hypothetical protein
MRHNKHTITHLRGRILTHAVVSIDMSNTKEDNKLWQNKWTIRML